MHRVERATVAPETLRCHPGAGDTRRRRWEPHSDGGGGGRRQDVIFINVRNDKKTTFFLKIVHPYVGFPDWSSPGTGWDKLGVSPRCPQPPRQLRLGERNFGKASGGIWDFFFFFDSSFWGQMGKRIGITGEGRKTPRIFPYSQTQLLGLCFPQNVPRSPPATEIEGSGGHFCTRFLPVSPGIFQVEKIPAGIGLGRGKSKIQRDPGGVGDNSRGGDTVTALSWLCLDRDGREKINLC